MSQAQRISQHTQHSVWNEHVDTVAHQRRSTFVVIEGGLADERAGEQAKRSIGSVIYDVVLGVVAAAVVVAFSAALIWYLEVETAAYEAEMVTASAHVVLSDQDLR